MYKVMTFGALLVGLALAPVLSGGLDPERKTLPEVELPASNLDAAPAKVGAKTPDSKRSCQWECSACEAGQDCTHSCMEVGECGSSCGFIMQCVTGQTWNEASCSCE